jgi:predicted DsbA family dithiol-disulfide isomerase
MPRDVVRAFLDTDDGRAEVTAMIAEAAEHGITAVPTYVFAIGDDGPGWMVPGAQDPETFVTVLRRLAERAGAGEVAAADDAACADDACELPVAGDA